MADEQITRVRKIGGIIATTLLILVPSAAFAQVVINEIMYAGKSSDWVEIINNGATPVDLSKGCFYTDDNGTTGHHGLVLSNGSFVLQHGDYAIISNATSTFVTNFPQYAGTLFYSAFSLLQIREENVGLCITSKLVVDDTTIIKYTPVDSATKDGMSLQFSGGSWIAALPTPGVANATTTYTPPSDNTNSNTASTTGSTSSPQATTNTSANTSAPTSSYVAPPEPQIFADAGDNRTVIVAADAEFFGRAYNRKKETLSEHIRFLWNFGDGTTAEGQSVLHHFEYPGRYAVVLNIAENMDAASDRIIVTAEPAKLAFTTFADGSITIGNNAGRDLDLSNWIIRSFGRFFVVPKDSIILAGESLRLGDKTLGFRSSPETELDYPNGALALHAGTTSENSAPQKPDTSSVPASANPPAPPTPPVVPALVDKVIKKTADAPIVSDVSDVALVAEEATTVSGVAPTTSAQIASAATADTAGTSQYVWWLGAIGLAVAGGGAVLASRRAGKKEWDIVEENTE